MSIRLKAAAGGGSVELDVPNTVNSDISLTVPATAGEFIVKDANNNVGSNLVFSNIDTTTINSLNYPTAGPLSNRNIIINGAMTVSQRSTSQYAVTSSTFLVDRWRVGIWTIGEWAISQSTDAPSGFSNSLKLHSDYGVSSPSSSGYVYIRYIAEAQDLQQLSFGSSNAKSLTISFWVKSNKTGDASFRINAPDGGNRDFVTTYSIAAADTWEYKTISIPANTSETINNDNGNGFEIEWWLHSGSQFQGTTPPSGWSTSVNSDFNNSNLGVGAATNDYFQITGVQLEAGAATPFEHQCYADVLRRCQRYYQIVAKADATTSQASMGTFTYWGANTIYGAIRFPVEMRAAPSFEQNVGTAYYISYSAGASQSGSQLSMFTNKSTRTVEFYMTLTSNGVTGRSSIFRTNNANAHVALQAELF
jgi:hypothetical protein